MPKYTLPSESDAITLIKAMSSIIQIQGHVTVGQVHDLLGMSHTVVDERNGWRTTNHVLHPTTGDAVELEFSEPTSIYTPPSQRSILRLVMEFESSPEVERRLDDLMNATVELREGATMWSLIKRPRGPFSGPRVSYRPPAYGDDDL